MHESDEHGSRLERIVALARSSVSPDPAAIERLLERVRKARQPTFFLAPRLSLAAAILVALLSATGGGVFTQLLNTMMPGEDSALIPVAFVLVAQDAREVSLVGDFNDWLAQSTPMERRRDGLWSVVLPLPPGRYSYAYLVDGETWLADPAGLAAAEEDYGRPNSVLIVDNRGL